MTYIHAIHHIVHGVDELSDNHGEGQPEDTAGNGAFQEAAFIRRGEGH